MILGEGDQHAVLQPAELAQALKQEARRLGFTLAGIACPAPPAHLDVYLAWLKAGRQAGMGYLAEPRAVERRSDPRLILPECQSILVLGVPYYNPNYAGAHSLEPAHKSRGRVAAYAWGQDYHLVLPQRMEALVRFLEKLTGSSVPNRWYTDAGPILERELAMQAGLGWIGKNTCLINPQHGSYFLLSEILLGIALPPDPPQVTDQCGSCTRCIQVCPTGCIRSDRTLDATRCISYLTIENKAEIPLDLRASVGEWMFGCDQCQMVCPWNIRFAHDEGDPMFAPRPGVAFPDLATELMLTPQEFNRKFKDSPVKRAKRRGYLRNSAIVAGNNADQRLSDVLERLSQDDEQLVRDAAGWATARLKPS